MTATITITGIHIMDSASPNEIRIIKRIRAIIGTYPTKKQRKYGILYLDVNNQTKTNAIIPIISALNVT